MLRDHIRSANQSVARILLPKQSADFFCECDDPRCHERITLSREVYLEGDGEPTRFLVSARHAEETADRTLERREGYSVVA